MYGRHTGRAPIPQHKKAPRPSLLEKTISVSSLQFE